MAVRRGELAIRAEDLAPRLLGARLRSTVGDERVEVMLTEVEAYSGEQDPASHAYRGPTRRTEVMFGPAGRLYCYFVYGMHWCANITCETTGTAGAILLRAGRILVGEDVVRRRAAGPDGAPSALPVATLGSGPARLARALGVTGADTGLDLLAPGSPVRLLSLGREAEHRTGPRVGITVAVDVPWRFWLSGEPSVSTFRRGVRRRRSDTLPPSR